MEFIPLQYTRLAQWNLLRCNIRGWCNGIYSVAIYEVGAMEFIPLQYTRLVQWNLFRCNIRGWCNRIYSFATGERTRYGNRGSQKIRAEGISIQSVRSFKKNNIYKN